MVQPWTPQEKAAVDQRIAWKQQSLRYWSAHSHRSRKQLWVTEMQASPWQGTAGFTPRELVASARAYRGQGASIVHLWGVEDGLESAEWMNAAIAASQILRSPTR